MDSCFNYDDFDDKQNNQDNELNRNFQNNSENINEENKDNQNKPDENINFNHNLPEVNRMRISTENYFEQISAIPRLKSEKIIAFLKNWADVNGFTYGTNSFEYKPEANSDKVEIGHNLWIDVPASEGYENLPNVILQGHLDMVCGKDKNNENAKDHNFETDPIQIIKTDNYIKANGTTLGADNGIGIAMMMAIATGDSKHGPIRLLMTDNEECGCEGALSLDPSVLNADYLINLDFEDIGQICYASAGNSNISITNSYILEKKLDYDDIFSVSINGLLGGHSGLNINEGRLAANVFITSYLNELLKNGINPKLIKIDSGSASNALAADASVTFAIPKNKREKAELIYNNIKSEFEKNYKIKEINSTFEEGELDSDELLSAEKSKNVIKLLNELPQGVISMLDYDPSVVETSSNNGKISYINGELVIEICSRSFTDDALSNLIDDITYIGVQYGCDVESSFAPAWIENPNTPLVQLIKKGFEETTDIPASLLAIHAGLECSIFAEQKPKIQLVSLGPTIKGAHTTEETLYTDTIEPCLNAVNYCLKNINEINRH